VGAVVLYNFGVSGSGIKVSLETEELLKENVNAG